MDRPDDISSLGADEWEHNTFDQQTVSVRSAQSEVNPSVYGEMEEEDIAKDEKEYYESNAMVVDGFKCPDAFINILTPMEFEEMVNLFVKFDANQSGSIDKHEAKKILHFLGLDFSLEKAEDLLKIVDADGSGEIEFDEFCNFIVMVKRGDNRLQGFHSLLDKLHDTPLGELERQAGQRNLKISFELVEVRAASMTKPTVYIMDCLLSGVWYGLENGEVISTFATRKYQGMGSTSKEAKYHAATIAVMKMGKSLPGIKYEPGEFPDDWLQWTDTNLLRGVDPGKVLIILASKGFFPHKNLKLMHRIIAWQSLLEFCREHPDIDVSDTTELYPEEFLEFIRQIAQKGIDGKVFYQLLQDRCVDLTQQHLHFAQQLQNNELGCLMDSNERHSKHSHANLLDFHHACQQGYSDIVLLYCKCNAPINEEKIDRHTTERITPLAYAAMGGHAECLKILLEFGAAVNRVDHRGRNAMHLAAMRGHVRALEVLASHGGNIFAGDYHGNTPLHLSVLNNHYAAVDFLCRKGQDLARLITSDKVRCISGTTYLQLVTRCFEEVPKQKLQASDTIRFEKEWIYDASLLFLKLMDPRVKYMIPVTNPFIMTDVLNRFDPRPESGIFINNQITGRPYFIKTVANPQDLAILLQYMFRQAAVDSINSWKRTPLHIACDLNKVNSHESIIITLINEYGCNVLLKDMHQRRALDLLILDKKLHDTPTATQAREEVLIQQRTEVLKNMFEQFAKEEKQKADNVRAIILQECMDREENHMNDRLWNTLRNASIYKRTILLNYQMYEDPDTGSFFYTKIATKKLSNDRLFEEYTWHHGPKHLQYLFDRYYAIEYLRLMRSELLRKCGLWEVYRCRLTKIEFYHHIETQELRFTPPKEMKWKAIFKESTITTDRLGYANEWMVCKDKYDNIFYRNRITKYAAYERPLDAVTISPEEKLCSAYQFKNQEINQKWYSCEQCNRAWKMALAEKSMNVTHGNGQQGTSAVDTAASLLICEPCVARCHRGHRGVRYIYTNFSSSRRYCLCIDSSKYTECGYCQACQISEKQTRTQLAADNYRKEMKNTRMRDLLSPPVFGCVPRYDRRNHMKTNSGWQICRLHLPAHVQDRLKDQYLHQKRTKLAFLRGEDIEPPIDQANDDDTFLLDWDNDFCDVQDGDGMDEDGSLMIDVEPSVSLFSHASQLQEYSSTQSSYEVTGALEVGEFGLQQNTVAVRSNDDVVPLHNIEEPSVNSRSPQTALKSTISHNNAIISCNESIFPENPEIEVNADMQSIVTEEGLNSIASSMIRYEETLVGFIDEFQEKQDRSLRENKSDPVKNDSKLTKNCVAKEIATMNEGWIQVYDCEEVEELKHGDVVLCKRYKQEYPRLLGKVKQQVRPGFYRIRFEDRMYGEEVLERSYLEQVNRSRFHFNIFTGENCWMRRTLDESSKNVPNEMENKISSLEVNKNLLETGKEMVGEGEGSEDSPEYRVYPSHQLMISGEEWRVLYNQSSIRASFEEYDEMYHAKLDFVYYVVHELFHEERAALQLQILYRHQRHRRPPYLPWKSLAFSFDMPQKVLQLKKVKAGWAYLRRRSRSVGDFLDAEGIEWEEYIDSKTSQYFYWQEEDNMYRWEKPPLFEKSTTGEHAYNENDEVLYRFPGRYKEEICIVTRVRFDDQTGEDMYDIMHNKASALIAKWVPRIQLKPKPLEGDALMLHRMEAKWKDILRKKREADARKKQREKELRLEEEMKRVEFLKTLTLKDKENHVNNGDVADVSQETKMTPAQVTIKIMRGRLERISLEQAIIREEFQETEGKLRQQLIDHQVEELRKSLGTRLSRAEILSIQRSIEMKLELQDKVQKRNALQQELMLQRQEAENRLLMIEKTLRDKEKTVTTPRSLKRRYIVRQMHIAMKRQEEKFIICEWGCGDWLKIGNEQADHQLRTCPKRILPCALGCTLKHTEEYWLSIHKSCSVSVTTTAITCRAAKVTPKKKKKLKSAFVASQSLLASSFQNGATDKVALGTLYEHDSIESLPATEDLIGIISNQQYHDMHECPKRLVMCPLQCLEWVCAEVLDNHVNELCVKRPAKPLECRLGCGANFGGKIEHLIAAEDERTNHELEECMYRTVQCNWCYEDGRMCAAQMKATERAAHRDYHLQSLGVVKYNVPGTYIYRVPKNVNRMKVQLWGAGGGSGYFYDRQCGQGGGGAFVEAIIELEPMTILEITVGGGGSGGVSGLETKSMTIQQMREFTTREKQSMLTTEDGKKINFVTAKNFPVQSLIPKVEFLDTECGIAIGGLPGGGEGYGGGQCWACGGGGGYSAISKKSSRDTSTLLLAAGGGGGGSLAGLPGGGLEGSLPGTMIDKINGKTATVDQPGAAGESGTTYNSQWPPTSGAQYQGGNGSEFGAGGGGGYYGGGGGGCAPGIGGAGGGGSSYVYSPMAKDYVVISGHGIQPGGYQYHNPPQACGIGDWDKVPGFAGQGGIGTIYETMRGNNGAVILYKPGNY